MTIAAATFPGQGAQVVGMGKDVCERFAVAADTFAQADQALGFELSRLCFDGPAERLNATDVQQPAIFVTSVALYRAAVDAGRIRPDQFAACAGLSLGEYTALHVAGALPFPDALRLVYRRGALMQQACERSPGGMVSLLGMDEAAVLALCERVAEHGRVGPANFNCPGQIVISGDVRACEAAAALAEQFEGKAIALKVAGAFHSELMRPAAEALREELARADIRTPRVRVVSNVDAEYHGGPEAIRESLYRQVFNPVRWQACVQRLIADGVETFWEIGPGRVLSGLLRKIDRGRRAINVGGATELDAAG
ncbi:MAG: ACP S-malonyltransferase [Phycisphaerae bacterium]|nr:ACP S-malonyltransferase [Phycisphaerae bacterium]MCZ2401518.1 ACP S-malonyltransferase [Phycisphaerae bacterium]NUQ50183.1 ACP S-malonyltransferase [Phycisphaerae bacterium]